MSMLSAPIKRACDSCHRRKVKCSGGGPPPCYNCRQANLLCTYLATPKKKGPKGSRAKVISGLRDAQTLSCQAANTRSSTTSSRSLGVTFMPEVMTTGFIDTCVDYFFEHLYPTQPILNRDNLMVSITGIQRSVEDFCLITALCAYMLIQPSMEVPLQLLPDSSSNSMDVGKALLSAVHIARRESKYMSHPTVESVITAFFLFGCEFCLERPSAFFYLREATTLAIQLGMDHETYYTREAVINAELERRLFWLLFVTERAYGLQMQKPLSLHRTITEPQLCGDEVNKLEITGFLALVNLFKPFDDAFIRLWNHNVDRCTAQWTAKLQEQLSKALPEYLRSTETQAVDLKISQSWLRTMIWQLSIANRLLSSVAATESMTFTYPVQIARGLVADVCQFNGTAMKVHGVGLTKKIFDVACTLVDVMSVIPFEPSGFTWSPHNLLGDMLKIISRLQGGREKYLPLLLEKVQDNFHSPLGTSVSLDAPLAADKALTIAAVGTIQKGISNSSSSINFYPTPMFNPSGSEDESSRTSNIASLEHEDTLITQPLTLVLSDLDHYGTDYKTYMSTSKEVLSDMPLPNIR